MKKEEKLILIIVSIIAVLSLLVIISQNSISGKYSYDTGQVKIIVSTNSKGGYVSSSPSGIECGYACSESYSSGTQITLTAKSLGQPFKGWSGDCSGSSTTCTLTLDSDKTVSANFGSMQAVPQPTQKLTTPQIRAYGNIVSHDASVYPSACDDYPTMPGCPGEGTNIVPIIMPSVPDVTITGFEPKKGYSRNVVNIKGTNLGYVSKVFFNGELVEGFSVTPDGKELQTIVPQDATTGPIQLVLTSGGAEYSNQDFVIWTGKCSNPDVTRAFNQLNILPKGQKNEDECNPTKYLRVYSNYKELRNAIKKVVGFSKLPTPKINRFNPSPAMPNGEVSIIGELFDVYADEIKFDEKTILFKLIDDKEIKITVPYNANFGEHEIKVVSDIHGTGSAKIKIIPLPGITNFNPKKVWLNEEIKITGENFYEITEISFFETKTKKEILTKDFKASLEQIKVNAPQIPGSYVITVKGKNSYAKSQNVLTVEAKPLPPEITSIEPEDGRLGNSAVIYGKNLNGVTSVTLNGYKINYPTEDSSTQKTIYVSWGIDQGVVEVKNPSGSAKAELLSNKNPVTKLITGKEETCFGGVGKGCYGSEDGKEEWSWGSQKIVAPIGCSNEVNGKRNCWVVPGSIKHDNCCARYPSGKMCGGSGKDGKPAGESNHDGKCVSEWDAAFWDVFWWRAFVATFDATKSTDLTPKASSRYVLKDSEGNEILSETAETLRLCASGGHELREQFDEKFCCSGKAVNKRCSSARGVQAISIDDGVKRTDKGADLSTVKIPLAPGEVAKPTPIVQPPKDESKPITEYTLDVIGAFSGAVNTEDGKIVNCRNQNVCKSTYSSGTKITLIAKPDYSDYENSGWHGDCSGTDKNQPCALLMDRNKEVSVGFFKKSQPIITQPAEYTLEIMGAFSGSVNTDDGKIVNCRNQNICKATYPSNAKVVLIAKPDYSDYENSGWHEDCVNTPKTDSCTLTMDSNKKVILGFFKKEQLPPSPSEFELEVEGAFSGSVKTDDGKITNCRNQNKCNAKYAKDAKVTIIATPDFADYENSGWFGDCAKTLKTENCVLTMDSNKKINLGFFKKAQPAPPPEVKPKPIRGRPIVDICKGRRYCSRPVRG